MENMHIGDPLVSWQQKRPGDKLNTKVLTTFLNDKYGKAKAKEFGAPLLRLDDMRSMMIDALRLPDEAHLKAQYIYCAHLVHAAQHFPLNDGSLGITWTWMDTDGRTRTTSPNSGLEVAAVLFNAAVVHCVVAEESERHKDGAHKAMQYYQAAAGLFDNVRQRLASEPDIAVTTDLMPHTLQTLTRQAMCHALHMHYIYDLLNHAPGDWLAKEAFDVSQEYSAVATLLCHPSLKDCAPSQLVHQAELYGMLMEARAHIHLATGLHNHQKYGEEIARLHRAKDLVQHATRPAKHLPRKFNQFLSKTEDRIDASLKTVNKLNKTYKQHVPLNPADLPALARSGKTPVRLIPSNDQFMTTCPNDPFAGLPKIAQPKPVGSPPGSRPPGSPLGPGDAGDARRQVALLLAKQRDSLKQYEAATLKQLRHVQGLSDPVYGRIQFFQQEARTAGEKSCLAYLLNQLSSTQAALHPCRDKLQQIDRHLKARRGADAGRDYAKTAELIRKQLDEIQRKADAVAKDAQAKFDSLEKLDMPEEKLERLSNTETQTVQQKEQIRGLSQEVEGELRRAFAALDDVGARLKGEGPGVSVQSYEATLQKTTSQTKAKVNDLLSRMGSLADSDGKTEEAKRLGVAVASYEKMLNTARAMADEIGSLEEQIRLLLKDTGDWARESTVVPGRGGADDKTAVFRPTPQDKTMNMRDTANEMERLKRDYADKKVSDEEYARRLRQLHRTAEVQPEEAATANYKKAHEELKSDAAQAMIDEITRDMCENVTKLTYDMKARKWNEEPLQVYIWDKAFDEGNLRMCFMMVAFLKDGTKKRFVAKSSKDDHEPDDTYYRDVETQMLASMLADAYNLLKPPKPIKFLDAFLLRMDNRPKNKVTGKPCLMHVEPYLAGDYKKHNNNWGYVNDNDRNTPQAFSHFTHVHTRGRYLVVDIQGVGDMYTDPQVHSNDGKGFGIGNCGQEGIRKFFATHECNALCTFFGLSGGRQKKEDDYGTRADGALAPADAGATRRPGSASPPPGATTRKSDGSLSPPPGGTTRKSPSPAPGAASATRKSPSGSPAGSPPGTTKRSELVRPTVPAHSSSRGGYTAGDGGRAAPAVGGTTKRPDVSGTTRKLDAGSGASGLSVARQAERAAREAAAARNTQRGTPK